jgi:hypothetical protein
VGGAAGFAQGGTLTDSDDEISWALTTNKKLSTKSLYRFLTNGGIPSIIAWKIWKCKLPLKIRIFLWLAFQDRIQTAQQLKARNWKGSSRCVLCGHEEDVEHLLFRCPLAGFCWAFCSEALGWDGYPKSCKELTSEWLMGMFGVSYQIGLSCFEGLAWAIWKTHNDMCMRKVFLDKPIDIIRNKVEAQTSWMLMQIRNFRPLPSHPSDIGFI